MIFTIKAPDTASLRAGVFESMKLGISTEEFVDNTFEVTVHSQVKLDRILDKSRGTIIASKEWGYE